jgi:hypothetical protein
MDLTLVQERDPALRARRAAARSIALTRVALATRRIRARRANHVVDISAPAATTALAADIALVAEEAHAVEVVLTADAALVAEPLAPAMGPGDPEEESGLAGESVMAEESEAV